MRTLFRLSDGQTCVETSVEIYHINKIVPTRVVMNPYLKGFY